MNKIWKEEAIKMKEKIINLKDRLINIEVELVEDAEVLLKKEIMVGIDENNKQIQIILSEEQKDDKNDETGYHFIYVASLKRFKTKSRTSALSLKGSHVKK